MKLPVSYDTLKVFFAKKYMDRLVNKTNDSVIFFIAFSETGTGKTVCFL